jgi:hypothetical protein
MGNRAAAGETIGVCEAVEGAGRANPPENRDGGGKADKPDDRETGRRPHDLTPLGPGKGDRPAGKISRRRDSASASRLPEA